MLVSLKSFTCPPQGIKLGGHYIKHVSSTRCLGVEINNQLKWKKHATEFIKSYSQNLGLLRSLYFLPIKVRSDFYV